MNRRRFLKALGIGVGAVALAPVLPLVPAVPPPLRGDWFAATKDVPVQRVPRMDILYGYAVLRPELACRVLA